MKMTRKLSGDETLKLVQLYGKNDCLWDIKSQNYRNKRMRATAWRNIVQEMQIEGLTTTQVKKKIKAIRATYYLEIDKIQKSLRSGTSGKVYVPKVKWFKELDAFIRNVTVKRKTTGNSGTSNNYANFGDAASAGKVFDNISRSENSDNSMNLFGLPALTPTSVTETPNQSGKSFSKRSKLSQMAVMIKDMKSVSDAINMSPFVEDTDLDIFGKHVAAQLKKLPEEQSVIAQEEIQKILSKCRLADIQKRKDTYIFPIRPLAYRTSPVRFSPSPSHTTSSNSN